jgi:hypothetical protein
MVTKAVATNNGSKSFRCFGSFSFRIAQVSHARRIKFTRHLRRANHEGHVTAAGPARNQFHLTLMCFNESVDKARRLLAFQTCQNDSRPIRREWRGVSTLSPDDQTATRWIAGDACKFCASYKEKVKMSWFSAESA